MAFLNNLYREIMYFGPFADGYTVDAAILNIALKNYPTQDLLISHQFAGHIKGLLETNFYITDAEPSCLLNTDSEYQFTRFSEMQQYILTNMVRAGSTYKHSLGSSFDIIITPTARYEEFINTLYKSAIYRFEKRFLEVRGKSVVKRKLFDGVDTLVLNTSPVMYNPTEEVIDITDNFYRFNVKNTIDFYHTMLMIDIRVPNCNFVMEISDAEPTSIWVDQRFCEDIPEIANFIKWLKDGLHENSTFEHTYNFIKQKLFYPETEDVDSDYCKCTIYTCNHQEIICSEESTISINHENWYK